MPFDATREIRESGGATWDKIPRPIGILPDRDPVAAEWADKSFQIRGWDVIFPADKLNAEMGYADILRLRAAGDVISDGKHVGIVSDEGEMVFSASSITGAVELNGWSFALPRTDMFRNGAEWNEAAREQVSKYTVRRFVGTRSR
jgi:hypothetical protein